jgi:hypothetical protein
MRKALFALALLGTPLVAEANIGPEHHHTAHALGCVLLNECTDGVEKVESMEDVERRLEFVDFSEVREESDAIISKLLLMGVDISIADAKYFPPGNAGVYQTDKNKLVLNAFYSTSPKQFLQTLRHEGWHAAQDAFAGTIDNPLMAIIRSEEDVPREFKLKADVAYSRNPHVIPWEAEAKWAGGTPGMTVNLLDIIIETENKPWTVIDPTPLTRKYLVDTGYISE